MYVNNVALSWRNLSLYLNPSSGMCNFEDNGGKYILKNLTGVAKPSELYAVMGPSGAGKTSLFDCLSGRLTSGLVSGKVRLNGHLVSVADLRKASSYVQQHDLFTHTLTVKEHLLFHSKLKMDIKEQERLSKIQRIMEELDLKRCENSLIGSIYTTKSLSGGERRRLSLATELLNDLPILFCDEPTTGLDSTMAKKIVDMLQKIAVSKKLTVICTIHQPSSEIFIMFDQLLLLANGRTAFTGKPNYALKFFANLNLINPPQYNPADFYLENLSTRSDSMEKDSYRIKTICDKFEESIFYNRLLMNKELYANVENTYQVRQLFEKQRRSVNWFVQFWLLLKRSTIDSMRNPSIHLLRLFQKILLAIIIGICFMGVEKDQHGIVASVGALFFFVTENTFPNMYGVIQVLPSEFPLIFRETRDNMYRVDAYYFSKIISMIPGYCLDSILFTTIAYWMIGFSPKINDFLLVMAISILTSNTASACGCMFSAIFKSVPVALMTLVPFDYILMITAGIFINISSIPKYVSWLKVFSWFHYSLEAMTIVQWKDVNNITCEVNTEIPCLENGKEVLYFYGFEEDKLFRDIMALIILFGAFHVIGFLAFFFRTQLKSTGNND